MYELLGDFTSEGKYARPYSRGQKQYGMRSKRNCCCANGSQRVCAGGAGAARVY